MPWVAVRIEIHGDRAVLPAKAYRQGGISGLQLNEFSAVCRFIDAVEEAVDEVGCKECPGCRWRLDAEFGKCLFVVGERVEVGGGFDVAEVVGPAPWIGVDVGIDCLLYTSPSPRDQRGSRMPSSA